MYSVISFCVFLIIAYLLGSLSSAIIGCRLYKLPDPRTQGSGNPGATNVLRVAGKKLAIIVLLGDALKGVIPVALAKLYGLPVDALAWIAFAAFLGHLYPIFFHFRGGKGVATAFGTLCVFSWPLALLAAATWLVTAVVFRYSALAALVAAVIVPIIGLWLLPILAWLPLLLMCVLLIMRHKSNIRNLLSGKEDKIGARQV